MNSTRNRKNGAHNLNKLSRNISLFLLARIYVVSDIGISLFRKDWVTRKHSFI